MSKGTFPTNNGSAGLATAASIRGNNVSSVTVGTAGAVTILYSGDVNKMFGKTMILTPKTGRRQRDLELHQRHRHPGLQVPPFQLPLSFIA